MTGRQDLLRALFGEQNGVMHKIRIEPAFCQMVLQIVVAIITLSYIYCQ